MESEEMIQKKVLNNIDAIKTNVLWATPQRRRCDVSTYMLLSLIGGKGVGRFFGGQVTE